jgi:hypothetical protein
VPKLLILFTGGGQYQSSSEMKMPYYIVTENTVSIQALGTWDFDGSNNSQSFTMPFSHSSKTISWYSPEYWNNNRGVGNGGNQCNASGTTYYYIAIG